MRVTSVESWKAKKNYNDKINGKLKKRLHRPEIEPGPPAWQASILPLNQRCWVTLLPTKSICDGASLNVRDLLNVSKRVWMPRCGKEIWSQVPPRFELGSQDSESWVLTITPWNPAILSAQILTWSMWVLRKLLYLANSITFYKHPPLWSSG